MHEDHEPTPESRNTEHTRESVFNRLERPVADLNLDDNYDSEYEHLASSRGSADLCPRLNAQWAQHEQQVENRPPIQATPEDEHLTQMQAQIDQLLVERSIPDPIREVLSERQSPFPVSISTTIPPGNFKMPTIPLYDGKMNPVAHVQTYRTWMTIAKANASTLCNALPLPLSGPAQDCSGDYAQGRSPALNIFRNSSLPSS